METSDQVLVVDDDAEIRRLLRPEGGLAAILTLPH